jgi:hypothetical protein
MREKEIGLASRLDRMTGTGLIRRVDWKEKEGREESSGLHLFIGCEQLGLHDTYVEDSSVSHLVSNEVQNEHTAKCYLGLQVAYRHTGVQ